MLIPLLQRFSTQVDHIVIIDNTPKDDDRLFTQLTSTPLSLDQFFVVRIGENLGIATALNIGIAIAKNEGADFVVLSDQDSLPDTDMVPNLLAAFHTLIADGNNVGGIGPTFTDLNTERTYPFQSTIPGNFFYGHTLPTPESPQVEAITLITSGTLIPMAVFDSVGDMREDLFIDHVDTEWCHRARALGYHLYGTGWARMHQRLGDQQLKVWYGGWHYENAYSPIRIYYRSRNFITLLRLGHIDIKWKIRGALFFVKTIYSHTLFSQNRIVSIYMAIKGIWHGIIGRMGEYQNYAQNKPTKKQ
jgi:rhamnosyltransferase